MLRKPSALLADLPPLFKAEKFNKLMKAELANTDPPLLRLFGISWILESKYEWKNAQSNIKKNCKVRSPQSLREDLTETICKQRFAAHGVLTAVLVAVMRELELQIEASL